MTKLDTRPFPSALPPTEAELAAWRALPRDEQLARYREALQSPKAARITKATMPEILTAARQRAAARRD